MAGISTTIELKNKMSNELRRVSEGLSSLITRMEAVDEATNRGFDTSELKAYANELNKIQDQFIQLEKEIKNIGSSKISTGAIALGNVMGNLITKAADVGVNSIKHMIDEYNSNIRMSQQLAATLSNTSTNPSEAYNAITEHAKDIQSKGMFSEGSMVGAGAELATYFSDSKAIEMMMDTLTDYAAGMSGGKAIDTESMVNYATNLGKIMTGSYQAMNLKGFEFTDTQKKIIEGTATQAELEKVKTEMVKQGYEDITDEMIQAFTISQSITESWGGMYDAMSQTPEGRITQLFNNINSVASDVGGKIQYFISQIANTINQNMDKITVLMNGLGNVVSVLLIIFNNLFNILLQNIPIAVSTLAVLTAGFIANTVAMGAQAVATFAATVAQQGLNAALGLCPITWIVMGIAAITAGVISFAQHIADTTEGVNSFVGVIVGGLFVAKQAVINVFNTIVAFVHNRIVDIQLFFYGLLDTVNSIILAIVNALNKLPFINIDTSSFEEKAADYANKKAELENSKTDIGAIWAGDWAGKAFKEGAAIGDQIADKVGKTFEVNTNTALMDKLAGIENNTGDTVTALTENDKEDLAYIRDLAEQETINRFTTAEIRIDMGGINQNISKDTDADSVIDYLVKGVTQGIQMTAEGAYA